MKKIVLPLMLVCGVMSCQPVMGMEQIKDMNISFSNEEGIVPWASNYIGSYDGNLTHLGNGVLEITAYLNALNTDKLEIVAQIQKKNGSIWSDYGSAIKATDPYVSVAIETERTVSSGTYRVKYTYNAYVDDDIVETRSKTTGSKTITL